MKAVRMRTRVDLSLLPRRTSEWTRGRGADAGVGLVWGAGEDGRSLRDVLGAIPGLDDVLPAEPNVDRGIWSGELARLPGFAADSMTVTERPVSDADQLQLVLSGAPLPIPLDTLRGGVVDAWMFPHADYGEPLAGPEQGTTGMRQLSGRAGRCKPGDEGHFRGVITNLARNPLNGKLTIQASDMSLLLRRTPLTAEVVDQAPLGHPVWEVVHHFVTAMDGGEDWSVAARGRFAEGVAPEALLSREKRIKTKDRYRVKELQLKTSYTFAPTRTYIDENGTEVVDRDHGSQWVLEAGQPIKRQAAPTSKKTTVQELKLERVPGKVIIRKIPPVPADVFADCDTLWDAILCICTLMGCVPEVAVDAEGVNTVYVIDASELQAGGVWRTFQRQGPGGQVLPYRRVVVGEDVVSLTEDRQMMPERKADYVEVYAPNPEDGEILRKRWGRLGQGDYPDGQAGVASLAPGVTSEDHLVRLAKALWDHYSAGDLKVTIGADVPWTAGGSVGDADALGMGPGSVVSVELPEDVVLRHRGQGLIDVLVGMGYPQRAAEVLAAGAEEAPGATVFTVAQIVHTVPPNGAYSWVADLQTAIAEGPEGELS